MLFKNKYSKWELLETFYFEPSWYVIQVRQNLNTGYKVFKCKKIISGEYGRAKISVEKINEVLVNQ